MVDTRFKKGHFVSEETRRKISESNKGRISASKGKKMSEEVNMKNSESQKRVWANPEYRKKMSEVHKGKKWSEEQRKKMIGRTPWNKGISPTEETIRKSVESRKNTLLNPEIRKRVIEAIRKANKGRVGWNKGIPMNELSRQKMARNVKIAWSNPELRKKQSESHKGLHLSPQTEFKKGKEGFVPWMKGKTHSEDSKLKMKVFRNTVEYKNEKKEQILRQFESGQFPNVQNTKPERQIKEELLKRGYIEGTDFIHQYKLMNKFMCDFCFPKQKVIVEVNGDYWHVNPIKYLIPKNQQQVKAIIKDKSKRAYISKIDNSSWTYLELWESDINKDVVKCVDKIVEVLKSKLTQQTI